MTAAKGIGEVPQTAPSLGARRDHLPYRSPNRQPPLPDRALGARLIETYLDARVCSEQDGQAHRTEGKELVLPAPVPQKAGAARPPEYSHGLAAAHFAANSPLPSRGDVPQTHGGDFASCPCAFGEEEFRPARYTSQPLNITGEPTNV